MTHYRLAELAELTRHLGRTRQVWQRSGAQEWCQADASNPPPLEAGRSVQSAKGFFFAEQEHIFEFDGRYFRETLPKPAPFALIGVSSCDLVAIAYQDQFFANDPHYQARRQQALLVGLECTVPCEHGFCPTVDAGPAARPGTSDLVLHPVGDGWLLTVTSEQGRESLQGLNLTTAPETMKQQRLAQLEDCERQFPDDQHIRDGVQALNAGTINASTWQQMGIQCLSCSGCTSLCPTCSCYGVQDQSADQTITRRRFWDSCLYDGFQREASQHNPSDDAGARVYRFWYHKFSDDFRKDFGRYGCVGCGRCEATCPGVIGIHSVMKRISQHD